MSAGVTEIPGSPPPARQDDNAQRQSEGAQGPSEGQAQTHKRFSRAPYFLMSLWPRQVTCSHPDLRGGKQALLLARRRGKPLGKGVRVEGRACGSF